MDATLDSCTMVTRAKLQPFYPMFVFPLTGFQDVLAVCQDHVGAPLEGTNFDKTPKL